MRKTMLTFGTSKRVDPEDETNEEGTGEGSGAENPEGGDDDDPEED